MTSETPLPKITPSALSPCPDCGHSCSKQAEHCPNCGRFFRRMGTPESIKVSREGWALTIALGIILAAFINGLVIFLLFLFGAFSSGWG